MRRKRSHLSKADCLRVFEEFSKRVTRMSEGSGGMNGEAFAPQGHLTLYFQCRGSFGQIDEVAQAVYVLSGQKLPRKDLP